MPQTAPRLTSGVYAIAHRMLVLCHAVSQQTATLQTSKVCLPSAASRELADNKQAAIQFNIQECAAVNSTAPNFVGCSPFSLTTGSSGRQSTTTSASASDAAGATTISGSATVPTGYPNSRIGTAKFAGSSLLTGTCSVPLFAQVTNSVGSTIQFPQVGCAFNRADCCPFEPELYVGITKCPTDYTTTAGACCPR